MKYGVKRGTVGPFGPDRRPKSSRVGVNRLAIVPRGEPRELEQIDRIADEPDRPVPEQSVDAPAVLRGERDIRPFAFPGFLGRVDSGARLVPRPGVLVWLVSDGREVLGAVVGPVLHLPEVAHLVPLPAVLTSNQAVAN